MNSCQYLRHLTVAFSVLLLWACRVVRSGDSSRIGLIEVIQSPRTTNWGTWRPANYCPAGKWAIGAQLRSESTQPGDDSALNSVKLLCAALGKTSKSDEALSYEGLWGNWKGEVYCTDSVMTGFTLRSESDQHSSDDTAGNDLKIYCSNGWESGGMGGQTWGSWTARQTCRTGYALCGLSIQFEPSQGGGDDTALNNVDMACCQMAAGDLCVPTDKWQELLRCDNRGSSSEMACSWSKTIGTSFSNTITTGTSTEIQRAKTISAEVGVDAVAVQAKFGQTLQTSTTTGYSWSSASTSTYDLSQTTTVSINVPVGICTIIQQVVAVCGYTVVQTNSFRSVNC